MHFIRGLYNFDPARKGCALTIGNFDGIHLGHQALLKLLLEQAHARRLPAGLMSFDPLPHEYFSGGGDAPRLMSEREKYTTIYELSDAMRPDWLLILRFNAALASMTADAFIERILVGALGARLIVIGDDFHFGNGRTGNYEGLKAAGERHGFEVLALSTHSVDNTRVSSTRIREALLQDRLDDATYMLGRRYRICGRVGHGAKRGRTIGFPTANIRLQRASVPVRGVYSVTLCAPGLDGGCKEHPGVANVGRRPTVDGIQMLLEVHLFDFHRDLYGQNVCVSFHHKIRDEKKFDSFDLLRQQIEIDCRKARQLLYDGQ